MHQQHHPKLTAGFLAMEADGVEDLGVKAIQENGRQQLWWVADPETGT